MDSTCFLLQGQSVTSPIPTPDLPPTKSHYVLGVLQLNCVKVAFAKFIWSEMKKRGKAQNQEPPSEGAEQPTCIVTNLSVYFQGPRGLLALPAWEKAAQGPR